MPRDQATERDDRPPTRGRPVRRVLVAAAVVLLGIPAAVVLGLLAWDGDFAAGNDRVLLPGVQLDLRTTETALGPVEYDRHGEGGPVVLTVHAGLGGADQGRLFAAWLQDAGFTILSPSRPGYLGTPLTSGRTPEEQAALLVALLDELGIDRVGVMAVSAGGPVAYTLAARYPERVWGLVSVGAQARPEPGPPPTGAPRPEVVSGLLQRLVKLTAMVSPGSVVTGTLDETSLFSDEQKERRTSYVVGTPQVRDFFGAMLATTFPYEQRMPGTRNDAEQLRLMPALPLEDIAAPSLVVHGTLDGDVPFDDGVEACSRIPDARCRWMTDDDHLGFWLSPAAAQVQGEARSFLVQHAPR